MLAIEMKNVVKKFGNFLANDKVNLKVQKGEIHALLGENGAGKSTLMNILFGLYKIDGGEILINEQLVKISSPIDSQKIGIGMVHQHFMLVDTFSVLENVILGKEKTKKGQLYLEDARVNLEKLIEKYNFDLNINDKVKNLTVGQKQRIEILKVLDSGADILIFDEPTAVLTPQEVDSFLKILKNLQKDGKTIILITHKLSEIKAVAQKCTVLRKGKTIGEVSVEDCTEKDLAEMMVGKEIEFVTNTKKKVSVRKMLEIKNLNYTNSLGVEKLRKLNLTINSGKILGIAGVDNNGQKELVDILTRLVTPTKGSIKYYSSEGEKNLLDLSIREVNEGIISCIPEDRLKDGLILEYNLAENSVLKDYYKPRFNKMGFLKKVEIEKYGQYICEKYDVRSSNGIKSQALGLSGGNQQKLIIGRELEEDASIIIAFQPTRGVDVGAINFIHENLIKQRDQEKAVVLISMELNEILSLSDDIAVIHDGEIVDVVDASSITREEVGLMMGGKKNEDR